MPRPFNQAATHSNTPGGVSDVWQTKDLRERVFGSVAMIGLTGRFFGSVANKGVSFHSLGLDVGGWRASARETCREAGVRSTARRGIMAVAGQRKRIVPLKRNQCTTI